VLNLPPPEELKSAALEKAQPWIKLFGLRAVQSVYSAVWQHRVHGLDLMLASVVKFASSLPAKPSPKPSSPSTNSASNAGLSALSAADEAQVMTA
jgi:hypothetical protein